MVFFVHIAQRHQLTKPRHIAQKTNTRSTRFCAYCTILIEHLFCAYCTNLVDYYRFFCAYLPERPFTANCTKEPPHFCAFCILTFGQFCAIIFSQNIGMGKRTDVPFLVTKRGLCKLHKRTISFLCKLPIALFLILWYYIYIVRNEH